MFCKVNLYIDQTLTHTKNHSPSPCCCCRYGKRGLDGLDDELMSEAAKRVFRYGKRDMDEEKRVFRFGKRGYDDDIDEDKRVFRFGKRGDIDEDKRVFRFGKICCLVLTCFLVIVVCTSVV